MLTPENSKGITKLAALVGWTPTSSPTIYWPKPWKRSPIDPGALEGFLGAIYYPDRTSAQSALDRVTQMTPASFNGRRRIRLKAKFSSTRTARLISGSSISTVGQT